jgi:hypothetical protein
MGARQENVSLARRVGDLETAIIRQELILIRTTFVVMARGHEPEYRTVAEVLAAAGDPPRPVELRRISDLELLINPVSQVRQLRHTLSPAGRTRFDDLKSRPGVRVLDIEIRCHEAQLEAIRSTAPTTASYGGNRAGKSMILVWRLFRRWVLRGGRGKRFWWVAPVMKKAITEGLWVIAGPMGLGGGVWPDEVFASLRPVSEEKKNPSLRMIDGSTILFEHGNFGDARNLKSANVTDAVVDEVGAIKSLSVWHQAQIRVSQSGGTVAASTTRVYGHWSHEEIALRAKEAGEDLIKVMNFDLFDNPFMSYAAIWQLFLNDKTLTRKQLENQVLPAADKRAACMGLVTRAKSLREHFGVEVASSMLMWTEWDNSLIYASERERHDRIHIERDGRRRALVNITEQVLAREWRRAYKEGRRFRCWAGFDPNVRGHAAVLELFGEGRNVEEAVANSSSWTVLVSDEVQVDGSTMAMGEALFEKTGACPLYYDPHGAPGHTARGTEHVSDAEVLRKIGFFAEPATGQDIRTGKVPPLAQIPSRNVMHILMQQRRFLVHQRCVGTIEAMNQDRRKPDGRMDKRSSPDSPSDFLSGHSDAVRYGLWPIFGRVVLHEENDE